MNTGLFTPENSLLTLFLSSFLGATVLPGGSEIVLFALLKLQPELIWWSLAIASVGNTLGALTSYLLGRFLPGDRNQRAAAWLRRYGSPALLLAWAPLVGDALCVAAGWLRINPWQATLFMFLGKAGRYAVISLAAA